MGSASDFDYSSLKELLKDTNAEVLNPTDGPAYEKSIERWSENCIKRAVSNNFRPLINCRMECIDFEVYLVFDP